MVERKAPARKSTARKPRKTVEPAPTPEPETPDAVPAGPEPHPTGYIGDLPDETPNEHYTLSGVIAGKHVPEHDK